MDPLTGLFERYDPVMTMDDLAVVLGIRKETAYKWVQAGHVPSYRVGGSWVIYRDEVREHLRARRNAPANAQEPTALPVLLGDLFAVYPPVLELEHVCTVLGKRPVTVLKWLRTGLVPAYRFAMKWLVIRDEVRDFIAASRTGAEVGDHVTPLLGGLEETVSLRDLATRLCQNQQTVYNWLRAGHLPGYKIGSRWMIVRDEVIEAVRQARNTCPPSPERVGASAGAAET